MPLAHLYRKEEMESPLFAKLSELLDSRVDEVLLVHWALKKAASPASHITVS